MDDMLSMILTWFSPLIAWLPLSGKEKMGEPSVTGRPETYLFLGAAAAVPSGLLRLVAPAPAATFTYETAQTFFRSLTVDGLAGTLLPLAALAFSLRLSGRPHDGRTGAARASLIILAYCLIDGIFATDPGSGIRALPEAVLRSTPKLALAPIWGFLMAEKTAPGNRYSLMAATAVIGTILSGSVAFLLDLNLVGAAFIPSFAAFVTAMGLRYGALDSTDTGATGESDQALDSAEEQIPVRGRHRPQHQVYRMMREGRYSDARMEAERYLHRHTDLLLYSWQAVLRWLGGDRAYRLIFLQRYKALGEIQRRRFKSHLEDYLGEYASVVGGWLRTLEDAEQEDNRASR